MPLVDLCSSASRSSCLHFVGIGGIGMSGLAQLLLQNQWQVQGSNDAPTPTLERLKALGVQVFPSHNGDHISPDVGLVVASSAIPWDNPELVKARELGIPICHRSDILREILVGYRSIAISGTHGKTTTTSLMGYVLACAQKDPLVVAGGMMDAWASNVRLGKGEWAVVEADESDKSHLNFHGLEGAILTNIEAEHMATYKDLQDLSQSFVEFALMARGFSVACGDDPGIGSIGSQLKDTLTYGLTESCAVRGSHVRCRPEGMIFDVQGPFGQWKDVELRLWGQHNVLNALGVMTAAWQLGLSPEDIRQGLASFPGVQRRLTPRGALGKTLIIDDYAHHATEIKAVLETLSMMGHSRILAVCQPHRYSRLKDTLPLFVDSFHKADHVVLLPVYGAGEPPLPGIDSSLVVQHLSQRGQSAQLCASGASGQAVLREMIMQGDYDVAVFLGAGSITELASQLGRRSDGQAA